MIHNLNKDNLEDRKRKLGITYFILQTEQPLNDYEKVLELDKMNKVPVCKGKRHEFSRNVLHFSQKCVIPTQKAMNLETPTVRIEVWQVSLLLQGCFN